MFADVDVLDRGFEEIFFRSHPHYFIVYPGGVTPATSMNIQQQTL
jgi:hypothetical protein